jgi:RNA polymerase sigma factor (sigma-70 family)
MNTLIAITTNDSIDITMVEQNKRLSDAISREHKRLGNFIRQRVNDSTEAEDILQDVFFELVEAYRLPEAIEQIGAWLFQVARNRIIDRFRKKRELSIEQIAKTDTDEEDEWLELNLPALDGNPETAYARTNLLKKISEALDELPTNQRDIFIAHELDGLSFKEIATVSGINTNTLLGWKRQAILHLRNRLQPFYNEL